MTFKIVFVSSGLTSNCYNLQNLDGKYTCETDVGQFDPRQGIHIELSNQNYFDDY